MNFAIPLDRLYESQNLLAFFHPHPAYPFHVLLMPRQDIPNILALSPLNSDFLTEVFTTAQKIVLDYHLEMSGYRLIVNGGPNQDFPILHFHLIAESNSTTLKEQ
jgi:histidine triad (HIT) family protein